MCYQYQGAVKALLASMKPLLPGEAPSLNFPQAAGGSGGGGGW